jgi:hypothetical protein
MTHEYSAAARGITTAGRVERTGDDELIDVREAAEVDRVGRAADVRLQPPRVVGAGLLEKRHGNRPRPALSGTRTVKRSSISSPVSVGLALDAVTSLSPPNPAK